MKTKKRFWLILAGVTVAAITAAVPVIQWRGQEQAGNLQNNRMCYTETEVLLLMELTNVSRKRATEVLELACRNAVKPEE